VVFDWQRGAGGGAAALRARGSDGFGLAEFLPKRLLGLTGLAVKRSFGNCLKFTVERQALVGMMEILAKKPCAQKRSDRMLRLSSSASVPSAANSAASSSLLRDHASDLRSGMKGSA